MVVPFAFAHFPLASPTKGKQILGKNVNKTKQRCSLFLYRFESLAKKVNDTNLSNHPMQIILGVDRLDYTKGLTNRMLAFEKLLEEHPEHIGKVLFLQVAVPSRTDVKEYQELKEEMDKLVGMINGRFSTPSWSPIRYIYGCLSQDELAGFYR